MPVIACLPQRGTICSSRPLICSAHLRRSAARPALHCHGVSRVAALRTCSPGRTRRWCSRSLSMSRASTSCRQKKQRGGSRASRLGPFVPYSFAALESSECSFLGKVPQTANAQAFAPSPVAAPGRVGCSRLPRAAGCRVQPLHRYEQPRSRDKAPAPLAAPCADLSSHPQH